MLAYDTNEGVSVALTTDDGGARWRRCANVDSSATGIEASGPTERVAGRERLLLHGHQRWNRHGAYSTPLTAGATGAPHPRSTLPRRPGRSRATATRCARSAWESSSRQTVALRGGRPAPARHGDTFTGASVVSPDRTCGRWSPTAHCCTAPTARAGRARHAGALGQQLRRGLLPRCVQRVGSGQRRPDGDGGVNLPHHGRRRHLDPQMSNLGGELSGVDFVDDTNGWRASVTIRFPLALGSHVPRTHHRRRRHLVASLCGQQRRARRRSVPRRLYRLGCRQLRAGRERRCRRDLRHQQRRSHLDETVASRGRAAPHRPAVSRRQHGSGRWHCRRCGHGRRDGWVSLPATAARRGRAPPRRRAFLPPRSASATPSTVG